MVDDMGANDASIKVTSDKEIVAGHSMYRHNRREGSSSIGIKGRLMNNRR